MIGMTSNVAFTTPGHKSDMLSHIARLSSPGYGRIDTVCSGEHISSYKHLNFVVGISFPAGLLTSPRLAVFKKDELSTLQVAPKI